MLIEIEEKEEEEDSTGRNDDSNIFKNQSEVYFNQSKKIFLKNNKNNDNESKNNDIIINDKIKNYYKVPIYTNGNRKESNIFNNYIENVPNNILENNNKLNTINYIEKSRNNDNISKCFKGSFNSFSNNKINSRYNIIYRNCRLNSKENNFKDMILKNKKYNDNNQKISLPNLNIGIKENKKNLSSIKKYNAYNIDEVPTNNNFELKKYSSYSMNHHKYHNDIKENNENLDNMKINLLSSTSKSSNILIPIISIDNKINNYNCNLKDFNNENNYENIKPFYRIDKRIKKENSKNNINEIIPNKMIDFYNENKLLKKINNKKLLLENNNKLLMSIDNSFMSKLHKIKVEKGIMGFRIFESLNKNLLNKEYNVLRTSENNNINNKLPLIDKH